MSVTEKKPILMKNFRKNWKTFLGYGVMLLAFGLLLYYYQEVHEYFFQGWHFFTNKERVNNFVISFGLLCPPGLHWIANPAGPRGAHSR